MNASLHFPQQTWQEPFSATEQAQAIDALETGQLLLFPHLAFELQENEKLFLNPAYLTPKSKNISFHIQRNHLRGAVASEVELNAL